MTKILPQEVAQPDKVLTSEEKKHLKNCVLDDDTHTEGQVMRNPYSGAQIACERRAAIMCDSINLNYGVYLHMCEAWDKKGKDMTQAENDVYYQGLQLSERTIELKRTIFQKLWPESYKVLFL